MDYVNETARAAGLFLGAGIGLSLFKYGLDHIDVYSGSIAKWKKWYNSRNSERSEDAEYALALNKLIMADYDSITGGEMLLLQSKVDHPEYPVEAIKY